jgi:ADP-heptose:LPS heptosyltransferase
VVQLLPVLRTLAGSGRDVELVTRPEWGAVLSRIAPEITFSPAARTDTLDLDEMTLAAPSTENRTMEFMRMLGVTALAPQPAVVPKEWLDKWAHLGGSILFAPDATFASRQCPPSLAVQIGDRLGEESVVVVGLERAPTIRCQADLRGATGVADLFALVALARCVICVDSAVLHIATLLDTPAVALFGGIDPESRTRPGQRVVVLVGDVPCRPCNKHETCGGAFHCLHRITADHVAQGLQSAMSARSRSIRVV